MRREPHIDKNILTLNFLTTTKVLGAVCSRSTLFASILNASVILGNYLQQTTSVDDISDALDAFFSWCFKG